LAGAFDKCQRAIDALRAALAQQQAEPVVWMVYTEDGESVYVTDNPADIKPSQRALPLFTTAQQSEQNTFFNQAKGGYSNGKPAPTDQRVSGVVAGRDRCDERDQGERGRTGRNGGEVAVEGRTRPAMDQHRSDGSSAGADGANAGSDKTYNVLKQQTGSVQAEQGETMSNKQPEALRLAEFCDFNVLYQPAAAELRRLHEENDRLRGIVPEVLERLNDELCKENDRLRHTLAQQAEPVGWVGLTDKDRLDIYGQASTDEVDFYARAIEAALKEKNAKPVQAEPVAVQADKFCDANCTAMDHHPDCQIGNPSF
jgi:hypothetical protein